MTAGLSFGQFGDVDLDSLLKQAGQTGPRTGADRQHDSGDPHVYPSARQELLLSQVRRALAATAARREHTSMRERRLKRSADRLLEQARQAVAAGRDGYARQAMAWQATIRLHAAELDTEQAELRAEQERLSDLARRLQGGQPQESKARAELVKARTELVAVTAPASERLQLTELPQQVTPITSVPQQVCG